MAKYVGYLNSSIFPQADSAGWIVTTANPQTFHMIDATNKIVYDITNIIIEAAATNEVRIKYNKDASFIVIDAGGSEPIEDFEVKSITCISPIGTKFRFKALAEKVYGR